MMWPLRSVGILYLLSGLWCIFQYQLAAGYVGYELLTPSGDVEFISVYGGIQTGIALACLYFSFKVQEAKAATLFVLFISFGLLLARAGAMLALGVSEALISMAVVESFIVLLLLFQLRWLGQVRS